MGLPAAVHADGAGKCHGQQDITATGKDTDSVHAELAESLERVGQVGVALVGLGSVRPLLEVGFDVAAQ